MILKHQPSEVLAAGADILQIAAGRNPRNPHPVAELYADRPLSALAYAAGVAARPQASHENARTVMARGMGSGNFARAVAAGLQFDVELAFSAAAHHRAFCAEVEVRDFKPVPVVQTLVDPGLEVLNDEVSEISMGSGFIFDSGEEVQLRSYGVRFALSREDIINDDFGFLQRVVRNAGRAAARKETEIVVDRLTQWAHWDEGFNRFDAPSPPSDSRWFGRTLEALRSQAARTVSYGSVQSEVLFGLSPKVMVVSFDMEHEARSVVKAGDYDIRVIPMMMPKTRAWLFADPSEQAMVSTVRLRGSASPVRAEVANNFQSGGTEIRIIADLGAETLSGGVGVVEVNFP